jgi:hypothetical protein
MTNDNEKIVPFRPKMVVTPESKVLPVQENVVATLEDLLEEARAGHVRFLAYATVDADGVGKSAWSPRNELIDTPLLTSALGAVAFLNARFLDSAIAGSIDED